MREARIHDRHRGGGEARRSRQCPCRVPEVSQLVFEALMNVHIPRPFKLQRENPLPANFTNHRNVFAVGALGEAAAQACLERFRHTTHARASAVVAGQRPRLGKSCSRICLQRVVGQPESVVEQGPGLGRQQQRKGFRSAAGRQADVSAAALRKPGRYAPATARLTLLLNFFDEVRPGTDRPVMMPQAGALLYGAT
jgi:hypothetical protein